MHEVFLVMNQRVTNGWALAYEITVRVPVPTVRTGIRG